MSERIVTSLPKGLSDVTMRGSRESLRSSKESLQQSQESLMMSHESLCSLSSGCQESKTGSSSAGKSFGMPWRMLKKVFTFRDSSSQMLHSFGATPPGVSLSSENGSYCAKGFDEKQNTKDNDFSWHPASTSSPLMYGNQYADDIDHQRLQPTDSKESKDVWRTRNHAHIMCEMIQTEKDYVKALEFVIINYMPELNRDDVMQPLRGKRNVIFGNLEKIYEFHSQIFLQALEQCRDAPLHHVGDTFRCHASNFYLYALYNKNKPKSDALMKECGTTFFMRKQHELGERLDLSSYLLKPVQRMGKYALLLEELIKDCPEPLPDHSILKDALEMVKFQLRHGNDLLAMDCIRHCDISLQEQGSLLLQDPFSITQGRHKMDRHVFLFEDTILFTKPRRRGSGVDWLDYKTSFKTSDIGLTEHMNDEKKFEIWFRKRTPDVTYILEAPSSEVKRSWIGCISRLLWKQAIRNRQRRRNELVDMGHDLKPGIDLKQSSNYIQDHTVAMATHSKGPASRIRNSIAISSFDRFKIGQRRPYSMISVTSSSSSASSHSSGYPSSLSTTFEMPCENVDAKDDVNTQSTLKLPSHSMTSQWPCT